MAEYLITFDTWNQDGQISSSSSITYNEYTLNLGSEDSYVGCVATATSQILYYWGVTQLANNQALTLPSLHFDSSDYYVNTYYDYDMQDYINIYIDKDAEENGFLSFSQLNAKLGNIEYDFDPDEIAALSFAVGVKVQSSYEIGGTGAYFDETRDFLVESGFVNATVTDYEADSDGLLVSDEIDLFAEMVDDITSGYVVLVGIDDFDIYGQVHGRHAVVVDGYDSDNQTFHFNLGWGGYYDGWYSLDSLPAGYDIISQIVYNIAPDVQYEDDYVAPTDPVNLTQNVIDGAVALDWDDSEDEDSGVRLYTVEYSTDSAFATFTTRTISVSELFVSGLTDGTYYWRVKALDNAGNYSDWSDISSFTIVLPDITPPSSPDNLENDVDHQSVTLDWDDSVDDKSGVGNYVIIISENSSFADSQMYETVTSELKLEDLAEGNYYWRVRAVDNDGNISNWSAAGSFAIFAPDYVNPNEPKNLVAYVDDAIVRLDWANASDVGSGIQKYVVQYSTESDFSIVKTKNVTASEIYLSIVTDGTYYWRVKSVDNVDNESDWSDTSTFIVNVPDMTGPSLPENLSSTVDSGSVFLDWDDCTDNKSGVAEYVVLLSENSNLTDGIYMTVTTSELELSGIDGISDGTWYWRVKAVDAEDNSSRWSVVKSFNLDSHAPSNPTSLTDAVINSSNVLFYWNASVSPDGNTVYYVFECASDADFTSLVWSDYYYYGTSEGLSGLSVGTYYWRVKAVDSVQAGSSEWASDSFTIMPDGQYKLDASDYLAGDFFAQCVAIDGDTVVVGAGNTDPDSNDIYIYQWSGSQWTETKVHVSDNRAGWADYLDISGDIIVVGDSASDINGENSGSTTIYQWNGATWDGTGINASDAAAGDQFGWAAAVDGDRIAIGAPGQDTGAVYVYESVLGSWDEYKLTASDGATGDMFGFAVDIDGDTVVVGAQGSDANGEDSGSAYIYEWDGSAWVETVITASDGVAGDGFGGAVAVDGDTVVVSAVNAGNDSGAVYVYTKNGDSWDEYKLLSSDIISGDGFGWSVDIQGDVIVAGAHGDDDNGNGSGSTYIFQWDGSNWLETKISSADGSPEDFFGWSVALGSDKLVVGANGDDVAGEDSGSAYVYDLEDLVDFTPPTVPSGLTDSVSGQDVTLDWSDSDDSGSGLSYYIVEYSRNLIFSNAVEAITTSSNLDLSGLADGDWYWRVKAVDNLNNVSDWSEVESLNIYVPDTIAPSVPMDLEMTVNDDTLEFDWSNSADDKTGIQAYTFEYADNSNFNNSTSRVVATSDIDMHILPEGNYYWRVKATDGAGNTSAWSDTEYFAIDTSAPTAPSGLNDLVSGATAELDWNDSTDNISGVQSYLVEYADNAGFSNAVSQSTAISEIDFTGLTDGTWYWRVKAEDYNDNESAWSSVNSFLIDTTGPSAPALLSCSLNGNDAYLTWSASTDAAEGSGLKEYIVECADNPEFSNAIQQVVSGCELQLTGLSGGVYYWRVMATDNYSNSSDWSGTDAFSIDTAAPTVPAGLSVDIDGGGALLDWNDSDDGVNGSGVKQYVVQYADNAAFTNAVENTVSVSELAVADLDFGTWFWRVKAVDNEGNWTDWSNTAYFNTGDTIGNSFSKATAIDVSSAFTYSEYVGVMDAYDCYSFEIAEGASGEFDFSLTGLEAKTLLYLYKLENSLIIRIDATSSKYDSAAGYETASFENILLESGTYYLEVVSGDRGAGRFSSGYTLDVVPEYFPGASFDEFDFRNGSGTPSSLLSLDQDADGSVSGWVGFGDSQDVYELAVDQAGEFDFALAGLDEKAKLTLYVFDGGKYKKVASSTAKYSNWTGQYEAMFDNELLEAGTYYVEVLSGDKGAGKCNTDYDLTVTGDYFPAATANNSWDSATEITPATNLSGYVGFGDPSDFYKFEIADLASYDFELIGEDKDAKLTLYKWDDDKDKLRKVECAGMKYGYAEISAMNLDAGLYYVEVTSTDKGKGKYNTNYDLDITVA